MTYQQHQANLLVLNANLARMGHKSAVLKSQCDPCACHMIEEYQKANLYLEAICCYDPESSSNCLTEAQYQDLVDKIAKILCIKPQLIPTLSGSISCEYPFTRYQATDLAGVQLTLSSVAGSSPNWTGVVDELLQFELLNYGGGHTILNARANAIFQYDSVNNRYAMLLTGGTLDGKEISCSTQPLEATILLFEMVPAAVPTNGAQTVEIIGSETTIIDFVSTVETREYKSHIYTSGVI